MPDSRGSAGVDVQVDHELVRLTQAGDVPSLGHLLTRHRGEMMAVALAVLGRPADAEDAVQDATLAALSRIGDLRDPGAVGPWLKMIVRNCCRMQLRTHPPMPIGVLAAGSLRGSESDPARTLERRAARDWVWHALEQLSPPLRLVTMLRYFTEARTSEQIAAVCGVPVGTVRSRLSVARVKLSRELLTGGSSPHQDMAALTAALAGGAADPVGGAAGQLRADPGTDVASRRRDHLGRREAHARYHSHDPGNGQRNGRRCPAAPRRCRGQPGDRDLGDRRAQPGR